MWSISARGLAGRGQGVGALQLRQFGQHGLQVQALVGRGLAQADLTAAAEVQPQAAKDGGRARQLHGNLAQRLLGVQRGGGGGFQSGIHLDTPFESRAVIME